MYIAYRSRNEFGMTKIAVVMTLDTVMLNLIQHLTCGCKRPISGIPKQVRNDRLAAGEEIFKNPLLKFWGFCKICCYAI